jgi:hypothetical protein
MTESVGNETVEKCWCFLSRNLRWLNFFTWDDIKNILVMPVMSMLLQKWIFDGKFQIC